MSELENAIKTLKATASKEELPYIIADVIKKNCNQFVIKLILQYLNDTKSSESLEYGKWYPIEEYYKRSDKLDWTLVQFKETKTGFMPLPFITEYIKRDRVWTTHSNEDRYLCEMCEPVAFMLWQPYEEDKSE